MIANRFFSSGLLCSYHIGLLWVHKLLIIMAMDFFFLKYKWNCIDIYTLTDLNVSYIKEPFLPLQYESLAEMLTGWVSDVPTRQRYATNFLQTRRVLERIVWRTVRWLGYQSDQIQVMKMPSSATGKRKQCWHWGKRKGDIFKSEWLTLQPGWWWWWWNVYFGGKISTFSLQVTAC